jgi:hypothetical protein
MENWNYDAARAHADNIEDPTTRRLTQFFLTKLVFLAMSKYAVPENSEFDLLYYVKIIERISEQHDLIRRILEGEDLDAPWKTLADEFEENL